MRRSIATVCLSGTLNEKLEAIAAARFNGVEVFENDLLFFAGAPREVRRYAADVGLTIDLFQPFRDFEGVSDEKLKRNLDRAERKFDLMVQLGDAPRLGMNTLTLSRHFRSFPGQGDLDVPAFMRSVLAAGYTGTISLEIFSDDMRAAPPRQTANDAMRSLLFVEEQVRRA